MAVIWSTNGEPHRVKVSKHQRRTEALARIESRVQRHREFAAEQLTRMLDGINLDLHLGEVSGRFNANPFLASEEFRLKRARTDSEIVFSGAYDFPVLRGDGKHMGAWLRTMPTFYPAEGLVTLNRGDLDLDAPSVAYPVARFGWRNHDARYILDSWFAYPAVSLDSFKRAIGSRYAV